MYKLIDKLERKFGRYAVSGLMKYIVIIEIIGAFIGIVNPVIYYKYFALDFSAVFSGQIWRLVTFVFCPELTSLNVFEILMFAIMVYLYYAIGNSLEHMWGSFRFNVYYLSGLFLNIIAGLIMYIFTSYSLWLVGFEYINMSLLLAFACMYPNQEFYLYFLLPVKAKWIGILDAVLLSVQIIQYIAIGTLLAYAMAFAIVISMANFLLFFFGFFKKGAYKNMKRKAKFRKEVTPKVMPIFRHRCAICGRTERDNPDLEFRFCTKCNGNYEYCSDHIFTHEHVR